MGAHRSQIANDVIKREQREKTQRWRDGRGMVWTDKGPFMVLTNRCLSRLEHKDSEGPLNSNTR